MKDPLIPFESLPHWDKQEGPTITHKIFETNSSFHVKSRTMVKV